MKRDPLFDGPPLNGHCEAGALRRGMRFYLPNDPRRQEWLILDRPIVMRDPDPARGENWPVPVGVEAVDLATGQVLTWPWEEDVIRSQ